MAGIGMVRRLDAEPFEPPQFRAKPGDEILVIGVIGKVTAVIWRAEGIDYLIAVERGDQTYSMTIRQEELES